MKMVRPGPDIEEEQRPEMKDRQAIAVNRPLRLLGHEIIHHREEGHGQEKGDRIMSVPPLRQRILHPGEGRIALRPEDRRRDRQIVDDMEHRDGDDEAQVKRSEAHTSELKSLMRLSYAVFCLKKQINNIY